MHRKTSGPSFLVALFVMFVLNPDSAHAYLDPGSGSYVFQIIAATAVSAFFVLKVYWHRLTSFLSRLVSGRPPEDEQNNQAS